MAKDQPKEMPMPKMHPKPTAQSMPQMMRDMTPMPQPKKSK